MLLLVCATLASPTVLYFFSSSHYVIQPGVRCFHYHKTGKRTLTVLMLYIYGTHI